MRKSASASLILLPENSIVEEERKLLLHLQNIQKTELKSIIEQGYFKNDVTFKNYDENTIIKVETIKGVTSYKILEDSSDECNYYKLNKNFDSIKTVNTDISENDTSISFESSISNVIL